MNTVPQLLEPPPPALVVPYALPLLSNATPPLGNFPRFPFPKSVSTVSPSFAKKACSFAVIVTVLYWPGLSFTSAQNISAKQSAERDREREDVVAKLFEAAVADLKLPHLERIPHRADLEEAVCTTALADGQPKHLSRFYETKHPESSIDEVKKIATSGDFTVTQKGKSVPRFDRYSVAVRVKGGPQQATYWVGLGFYESATAEFIDCHFTDDVHYCGLWKKSISPACRGK